MNVRQYFFVLFVTPKTSFIQLQVCVSLTEHGQVVMAMASLVLACDAPIITPYLPSSALHFMFPLLKVSAVTPGLYFSALCHCVRATIHYFYAEYLIAAISI